LTADTEKAKLHKYFSFVFFFKENDLQTGKAKNDDRKVETISLLLKRLYDLVTGCVCWGQSMKKDQKS